MSAKKSNAEFIAEILSKDLAPKSFDVLSHAENCGTWQGIAFALCNRLEQADKALAERDMRPLTKVIIEAERSRDMAQSNKELIAGCRDYYRDTTYHTRPLELCLRLESADKALAHEKSLFRDAMVQLQHNSRALFETEGKLAEKDAELKDKYINAYNDGLRTCQYEIAELKRLLKRELMTFHIANCICDVCETYNKAIAKEQG